MKKLFWLILFLDSNLFAQGWNNTVPIGIPDYIKTEIFTNSAGIHILVQLNESNNIVYYNLNSAGVVCTTKTCTLETNGSFPNIVGTNDKIYAIYKTVNSNNENVIRVKYSTDNGVSWIWNSNLDRITSNADCNGVDAVYQEGLAGGVHIVWATLDGGTSGYETYYARLTYTTPHTWTDYKNVTDTDDGAAQYGGNPTVVVSPNRVHVSFNTDATTTNYGTGYVKTRDKYNGNWQTPQTVVSGSEYSVDERLLVRGEFLYLFYNCDVSPNALRFRKRSLSTDIWSDPPATVDPGIRQFDFAFEVTKTTNNDIHIIFKRIYQKAYAYSYINSTDAGTSWTSLYNFDENSVDILRQMGLSSVSNDLFCFWMSDTIRYFKQYDANPLAPQNLTATTVNNHPRLSWTKNNEADLKQYIVDRAVANSWTYDIARTTSNSFIDNGVLIHPVLDDHISYKIRAVDMQNHISAPSNSVTIQHGVIMKENYGSNDITSTSYHLENAYSNPFNPSTKISFSIKEEGLVILKVYDVLGKEVATLVNENKPEGYYEVEFDASHLPSGMYVYSIQAGEFAESKKMLLMK